MAWSTRELAELAGTSLRAVRHYHDVGLLEEPERGPNGYKRYGVPHLTRVLRIKRLTELGFSLSQIATMGDADKHPGEALRTLDAELATTIERLERARGELSLILNQAATLDLPAEFAQCAREVDFSQSDRALLLVLSRVLSPPELAAYVEVLKSHPTGPAAREFNLLPADADDLVRQELAERLAARISVLRAEHPGWLDLSAGPDGAHPAAHTIDVAINGIYNAAQVDVVHRVRQLRKTGTPSPPPSEP